jgi:hypothetical protein
LRGFNRNITPHEPYYPLPDAVKDLCKTEAEGAVSIYLFHRSRNIIEDLRCLRQNVKEVVVAALPLEAPPALIALGAAVGFVSFYRADEISEVMREMGFRRGRMYLKRPYYLARWASH